MDGDAPNGVATLDGASLRSLSPGAAVGLHARQALGLERHAQRLLEHQEDVARMVKLRAERDAADQEKDQGDG